MKTSTKRVKLIFKLFLLPLLLVSTELWATELEAKKDGVELFDGPSKKAKVVKKLKQGESFVAIGRKGMYWELENSKGFVSVTAVSRKKSSDGGASNAMRKLVNQGRDAEDPGNTRARSGVMGVRGLDESSDTEFAGNVKPNLRLVYSMEDIQVDEKKVEELESAVFKEIEKKSDI